VFYDISPDFIAILVPQITFRPFMPADVVTFRCWPLNKFLDISYSFITFSIAKMDTGQHCHSGPSIVKAGR
jgi:hypothetical protein